MNHKSIDYDDLSSFLPDNLTICNKQYWERRIDGLPDSYYELLEVLSRIEYSDKHIKLISEKIKQVSLDYNQRIENELIERLNELTDETEINKLLQENKNVMLNYYAK